VDFKKEIKKPIELIENLFSKQKSIIYCENKKYNNKIGYSFHDADNNKSFIFEFNSEYPYFEDFEFEYIRNISISLNGFKFEVPKVNIISISDNIIKLGIEQFSFTFFAE